MAATRTSLAVNDGNRAVKEIHINENDGFTTLLSRLGDDVMQLVNSQLALFKVEIKEEANTYIRGGAGMAAGAVVAAIGFALLNVALAFGVSTLFTNANLSQPASYALGFVVTGLFYLVVGTVVVLAIKSRLAKQNLVPTRSVEELRKDKEWLKNEL
jgi:uncharacterized membrane protein YqjE